MAQFRDINSDGPLRSVASLSSRLPIAFRCIQLLDRLQSEFALLQASASGRQSCPQAYRVMFIEVQLEGHCVPLTLDPC